MRSRRRAAVAAMLGARSMALVGASPRPDSFGSRMVLEAQRGSARFHLVNPRYDRIGELPCVPSLADLGEPVDVVLLGVPDAVLPDQLAAAAAAGARSAVLFGSAHGLRDTITPIATDAGMALCGAGCMGFVNNALGVRALGYLEPDPLPDGGVGLVTHSGSAFSTLLRARRGFGFRLAVSSGQELVTDTADYVDYALDDPETRIIGLLLETPRAVPRLRQALLRAAEQDVPVVILTVGGSPRGRAMVAAHSGALAGEHAAWQAFCAATGAVHVTDLAEFSDTLELFSAGRRAKRGGIATVHDSGAERALLADLAHEMGVEFAELAARYVDDHRRHARRRVGAHQPAGRVGNRCRHPQPVRRLPARDGRRPCRRGDGARRRPGHRVRRRHRLRRCGHRRRQAHRRAGGGAGIGRPRRSTRPPRIGCETAAFRFSKVPAAGWRRCGTWLAGRCPSTPPPMRCRPTGRHAGVRATSRRGPRCLPTTVCLLSRPFPPGQWARRWSPPTLSATRLR